MEIDTDPEFRGVHYGNYPSTIYFTFPPWRY